MKPSITSTTTARSFGISNARYKKTRLAYINGRYGHSASNAKKYHERHSEE